MRVGSGGRRWNHYDAGLLVWDGKERCGFVVKDPGSVAGYALIEVPNVASPAGAVADFFEISGADTVDIMHRHEIVGIWHSHPPGLPQPSRTDRVWHPKALGDIYIVCDVAIKRFANITNSIDYQEVPAPWLTPTA